MTDQTNAPLKDRKQRELEERLNSGRPLTATGLGFHLGVDRNTATQIAKAQGLAPEGSTYPWRRIWWQIHDVECGLLASHLDNLQARHPNSKILGGIEDLEVALRAPLVKYPGMAALLKEHPDTLRKQIDRGDRIIPFPVLDFGPRLQLYRPLDVMLWRDEERLLTLPKAESPAPKPVPEPEQDRDRVAPRSKTKTSAKPQPQMPPADRKKAIFAPAARSKRKAAG
ncbi:hypothetical protein [Sulfitobacter sp. 1A15299]|uniref:hypothetical protein n=1 Tax=Sulfitobacter sp. 1A15299 TaxID=3368598 RepID=UPI00374516EF